MKKRYLVLEVRPDDFVEENVMVDKATNLWPPYSKYQKDPVRNFKVKTCGFAKILKFVKALRKAGIWYRFEFKELK